MIASKLGLMTPGAADEHREARMIDPWWFTNAGELIGLLIVMANAFLFLLMGRVFFKSWPGLRDMVRMFTGQWMLQPFIDEAMRTLWGQFRLGLWIILGGLMWTAEMFLAASLQR